MGQTQDWLRNEMFGWLNTSQNPKCWRICGFSFPQQDVSEGHSREKALHGQRHGRIDTWGLSRPSFFCLRSPFGKMLSRVAMLSFMADLNFLTGGKESQVGSSAP